MSPSGGYLFLYPGSISRMFLLPIRHNFHSTLAADFADQAHGFLDTALTPESLERPLGRPIEIGREVREGGGEVLSIAGSRIARLVIEVGGNVHQCVDPNSLVEPMAARVRPLL